MLKLNLSMRIRGLAKVILVVILANQVLTTAFVWAVQQLDLTVSPLITSVFSFATCGLVGSWLQSDARRAYLFAKDKGCVTPFNDTTGVLKISPDCPKRWLVMLHIELNPGVVGL